MCSSSHHGSAQIVTVKRPGVPAPSEYLYPSPDPAFLVTKPRYTVRMSFLNHFGNAFLAYIADETTSYYLQVLSIGLHKIQRSILPVRTLSLLLESRKGLFVPVPTTLGADATFSSANTYAYLLRRTRIFQGKKLVPSLGIPV